MSYIITHNVIDNEEPRTRTALERQKFYYNFKLYDDDKELYFIGYSDDNSTERAFEPLDCIGASYGCTDIKYRNKNYQLESL